MSSSKNSILDHYDGRHILLTGATGFLGKVLFAMMLEQLPNLGCIYVLIRRNKKQSAAQRFCQDILASPVFTQSTHENQTAFNRFLLERVKVLEGDVVKPNLGLSTDSVEHLHSTLDLVIHVAGLVDFFPDIRLGLDINVCGALSAAEFVKQCQKASLIHVSTCYVVGNQSGFFEERIVHGQSPNGLVFNEELELKSVYQSIRQITEDTNPTLSIKKQLKQLGRERAAHWGWSNTYCYTKALAERLLTTRYPDISLTIIRPSIIESSISFPFSGWNEGVNGTAPLTISAKTKYPFVVSRNRAILDIVPVDIVSHAVLVIGADVLLKKSSNIYQLASSATNPCFMQDYVQTSRKWYRKSLTKDACFKPVCYLNALLISAKCITPNHIFAPKKLLLVLTRLSQLIHGKHFFSWRSKFKEKLRASIIKLRRIDAINCVYQSFIYDHAHIFYANKISLISFKENKFSHDINQINWQTYLIHHHLPGLNRWIFPLFDKRKPPTHREPILLNEHETAVLVNLQNKVTAA